MNYRNSTLKFFFYQNKFFSFSFAVVAEPDSDEEDCEDIGYSYVDVQELMKSNANYYDKELHPKMLQE